MFLLVIISWESSIWYFVGNCFKVYICEYLKNLEEEEVNIPEQQSILYGSYINEIDVVTVTKVDVIQKQLEELKVWFFSFQFNE